MSNSNKAEKLLARRLAGEDVARGGARVSHEAIAPAGRPDGDMKIGKSLRVPLAMFAQIDEAAQRRRMSWSALVRLWIAEGLARDAETAADPVVELHHHLDAATRALRELEGQRDAA
ncbi:MAG: hypothetical protein J2P15_00635 [Micromonosporaceae bacterium]|nr:hypothetical protein [Micromonosporaceae bacterium]